MSEDLTRSGVAYDLKKSPHKLTIMYDENTMVYTFSSQLYVNKFVEKMNKNRDYYNNSIINRFGIEVNIDLLADLKLYTKIEKRGFLLEFNNEEYVCLNNIKFVGNKLIYKS